MVRVDVRAVDRCDERLDVEVVCGEADTVAPLRLGRRREGFPGLVTRLTVTGAAGAAIGAT